MGDHAERTANYCPGCGEPVETAQSVAGETDLPAQGVFSRDGACAIADGGTVTVYDHAEEGSA